MLSSVPSYSIIIWANYLLLSNCNSVHTDKPSHIPALTRASSNHHSILNFCVRKIFNFHTWITSCGTCFSMSGSCNLAHDFSFHLCCHKWQDYIPFLTVKNYSLYARNTFSLSIHQLMDTWMGPFLGHCEICCHEHRSVDVFLTYWFHFLYMCVCMYILTFKEELEKFYVLKKLKNHWCYQSAHSV